jgi:type II secretory pathway pseudopilin PulG
MINILNTHKKGAMFGLDARIALAIFGALSVISGAALYSAIQLANTTQKISAMTEAGKAYESYILHTGTEPDKSIGVFKGMLHADSLVQNPTVAGWNGPYINYIRESTQWLGIPGLGGISLALRIGNDNPWGGEGLSYDDTDCSLGTTCFVWILLSKLTYPEAQSIDKKIDGSLSDSLGNLRIQTVSASNTLVFYKYMPSVRYKN